MPRDTHHTHSHILTYIQTPSQWHATVSLTCNDALYLGIAALIITRPVDPPSQTKKGRHEAFPGRHRDKFKHLEVHAALGHHKGAASHEQRGNSRIQTPRNITTHLVDITGSREVFKL